MGRPARGGTCQGRQGGAGPRLGEWRGTGRADDREDTAGPDGVGAGRSAQDQAGGMGLGGTEAGQQQE
jgi:hypothetical protein